MKTFFSNLTIFYKVQYVSVLSFNYLSIIILSGVLKRSYNTAQYKAGCRHWRGMGGHGGTCLPGIFSLPWTIVPPGIWI